MNIVNRVVGIYLILAAALAMLYAVIEPLVWDTRTLGYSPVWQVLDPVSGAGILLGMVFAYLGQRNTAGTTALPGQIWANRILCCGFLFVALLFFRSWFGYLTGRAASDVSLDVVWGIAYALYVPLAVATGAILLRRRADG